MVELNGVPADIDHIKALALNNSGHFTTIRVDDHRVRGLSLHLERLVRDCRTVFDTELDPDRVRHLVRHALAGTSGSVVVRVTVFDPALELGNPGAEAEPHVLVTTRRTAEHPLPPLRVQSVYWKPGSTSRSPVWSASTPTPPHHRLRRWRGPARVLHLLPRPTRRWTARAK